MNLLQNYHFEFWRLLIWRAKLDFDIIGIVFKMDSGEKIRCHLFQISSFPTRFMFYGFVFIRLFSKIKILGRFRLYNVSSISEHVTKEPAFLYSVT